MSRKAFTKNLSRVLAILDFKLNEGELYINPNTRCDVLSEYSYAWTSKDTSFHIRVFLADWYSPFTQALWEFFYKDKFIFSNDYFVQFLIDLRKWKDGNN